MRYLIFLLLFLSRVFSVDVADRIWKNECGGTIEGLTHWNKGENFPSLGIGHFIWYREGKKERFEETFPALLAFMEKEGVSLPNWLKTAKGCPWNSREEFYREIDGERMRSLRQFLFETRELQASFMAHRFEMSLSSILDGSSESVRANYQQLAKDPKGLYALLDYLNFKGSGTSAEERYKGQGWGLLQVLQRMKKPELKEFAAAAKFVLQQRVQNAPPERNEERWLKGWLNRIDTYL